MIGFWDLKVNCELTDADREHIAELIKEGFTSGQIVNDLKE